LKRERERERGREAVNTGVGQTTAEKNIRWRTTGKAKGEDAGGRRGGDGDAWYKHASCDGV